MAIQNVSLRKRAVPGRFRWRVSLLPVILPVLLLTLWQAVLSFNVFEAYQLAPPQEVIRSAVDLARSGDLATHTIATGQRVLFGFAIGAVAAVLLGTLVGLSSVVEKIFDPTLQALRSVPTLAWGPLLLLWLGIDEAPKVTLVAIGAFFPVYLNLVSGIRGVDRKLVEVGRIYNLSSQAIARRIILPACVPNLFTGLRLGVSQAWLFVVVAELIAATRGLGFLLTDSQNLSRVDLVLVAMLSLAILGKLTDGVLKMLEDRFLTWRDTISTEGGTG